MEERILVHTKAQVKQSAKLQNFKKVLFYYGKVNIEFKLNRVTMI